MKEKDLLAEALKVYGVPEKHILSSRVVDSDTVVFVTNGGQKITHRRGAKASRTLLVQDITGVPAKAEMVWSRKFNTRIKVSDLPPEGARQWSPRFNAWLCREDYDLQQ
jgi:hypothetical protein